ncbi:MAG: TRAP transporter substrate-binding protein [Acetobacteraceae bacterium]
MAAAISRKQFLIGAGAAAGAAILAPRISRAARPSVIKLGVDLPLDHPTTKHMTAAAAQIKSESKGAVEVQVFPSGQLGNDSHMLSDVRSGAIQMMGIGDNILAALVPNTGIDNIGFAFSKADTAFAALDGEVGDIVRADIEKHGLHPLHAIWDEGFREITSGTKPIKTVEDLKGFKIRVPESPISLSLFKDLGAAAVTMNVAELYTALQTHVVDGQENPLGVIWTQKFYQVQKYCALTNHMWVGYWMIMNGPFWKGLSAHHQKIVEAAFNAEGLKQRVSNEDLNNSLQGKLEAAGLKFNTPDIAPFREKLVQSGFYKHWQGVFGKDLWDALEKYTGTLA